MADQTKKSGGLRKFLMGVIGLSLSACGLAYVFRDIIFGDAEFSARMAEMFGTMQDKIRVVPLLGSIAIYWMIVVVIRSFLVRHLLSPVGNLRIPQAYRYICIGFLANNVLPFRAGEMARSAAITRGSGISFPSVVGGLALERMLDMTMVVFIALAALQMAPLTDAVRTLALTMGGALLVAFVVMVILSRKKRTLRPPDPSRRLRTFVWNLWVRFSAGFGTMGSLRGMLVAIALSMAIWAAVLGAITLRLAAFDLPASLPYGLVLLTSLGFGLAVPSAPGYLGVYHAAVAFSLELMGIPTTMAVAFGWFSWFIDIGISSLTGAISLSVEGLKLGDLKTGGGA